MNFSYSNCGSDKTDIGIIKPNWINNTLEIKTVIEINCAEKILNGTYSIIGNKIIFEYTKKKCKICTTCMCYRELSYKLTNIEKKGYEFKLKENIIS